MSQIPEIFGANSLMHGAKSLKYEAAVQLPAAYCTTKILIDIKSVLIVAFSYHFCSFQLLIHEPVKQQRPAPALQCSVQEAGRIGAGLQEPDGVAAESLQQAVRAI